MTNLITREREDNYVFTNFREMDEVFTGNVCTLSGETEMQKWAGYDRICNPCWRFGCHSNSCNCCVSPETSGVVGCNNKWDGISLGKRILFEFARFKEKAYEEKAQSNVEFAIVAVVIVLIVVGLAAILGKLTDGTFLKHAIVAASHNITDSVSGVVDAFCY